MSKSRMILSLSDSAATKFWRDLEARFRALQDEQLQNPTKAGLHAHWPGDGRPWDLSGGAVDIHKKFESLAESAARELGHPGGPDAVFFWLGRLKAEGTYFKPIDSMWADKGKEESPRRWKSGMIELVCKASADYCLKCAAQQVAGRPIRQRDSSPDIRRRRSVVYQHLTRKAGDLCHLFDREGVPLPKSMSAAETWVKAYRSPAYRHSIDSLIYRDREGLKGSRSHA